MWTSITSYLSSVWKSGCLCFFSLWILLLWKARPQSIQLCEFLRPQRAEEKRSVLLKPWLA